MRSVRLHHALREPYGRKSQKVSSGAVSKLATAPRPEAIMGLGKGAASL